MTLTEPTVFPTKQHHDHTGGERCPWCNQTISRETFVEIQKKIREEEREQAEQAERQLKATLATQKAELARQMAETEAKAKADIERERKDATDREAAARDQGKILAEATLQAEMAKILDAKGAAEEQVKELRAEQEAQINHRLQQQRELLEKAKEAEVNAEQAKAFADRQKLETQLQNMQRRLQNQTAGELGEGAEVNVYEALRSEFKDDRIKRIDKGLPGADIVHDVVHNDQVCGRIVYDSKNRAGWRNDYVTKLREDQLVAEAEHAILPSRVFPAGASQLHLQEGVIVVNPARVVTLAGMLRKHIIQTHSLRLSTHDRDQKTAALYDFINSERCSQLFERIETATDTMLDLENQEKKAHDKIWRRRGDLISRVQRAHSDVTNEIDLIVAADRDDW